MCKSNLKLLVLDVDGVLCHGKSYNENGKVISKTFYDADWTAIKIFKAAGIRVAFLTGDNFNIKIGLSRNIQVFGPRDRRTGIINKGVAIEQIADEFGVDLSEVAYVGDDIFDIPALEKVGYAFVPPEKVQGYMNRYLRQTNCHYTSEGTPNNGVVDWVLEHFLNSNIIDLPDMNRVFEIDAEEYYNGKA